VTIRETRTERAMVLRHKQLPLYKSFRPVKTVWCVQGTEFGSYSKATGNQ
jgi:hypothetical protein